MTRNGERAGAGLARPNSTGASTVANSRLRFEVSDLRCLLFERSLGAAAGAGGGRILLLSTPDSASLRKRSL